MRHEDNTRVRIKQSINELDGEPQLLAGLDGTIVCDGDRVADYTVIIDDVDAENLTNTMLRNAALNYDKFTSEAARRNAFKSIESGEMARIYIDELELEVCFNHDDLETI